MEIKPIKTIQSESIYEFKEKGSLFIGLSFPIITDDDASEILKGLRKKHYDATHHCYAYRLKNDSFKYSDDGEPNGTAGIRIFNAIKQQEVTDLLVVSIRYYGGVKLGVGPLGKAYFESAKGSLDNAVFKILNPYSRVTITGTYDDSSNMFRLLGNYEAKIIDRVYNEGISIVADIKYDKAPKFSAEIVDFFRGSIKVSKAPEAIYDL